MRAGYVGHKHTNGSKIHLAVDIPGHLLAHHVTPADDYDPAQVATLAAYLCVPNMDVLDSVRTLLDVCYRIVPHRGMSQAVSDDSIYGKSMRIHNSASQCSNRSGGQPRSSTSSR